MTIADFNRGDEFVAELFDEFVRSGNPLIDELWRKPAESVEERNEIGIALFETLIAGSPGDIRARFNRWIRALPLNREVYRLLYDSRTLRGNSHDWADAIAALLIRMPLASVVYRNGAYGNARLIIAVCLDELLRSSHVEGLDYDKPLETRMASLVDVVTWFARNRPSAKHDVGLAMEPMMTYLWNRKIDGQLAGETKEAVQRLYTFLDLNLNVCEDTQGAWPLIHEYCLKALGVAKEDSEIWRLQDDMPGLVTAFEQSLSHKVGPDLAERLLSDRDLSAVQLSRSRDVTDILLRLLRARELWAGTVGLGRENTYDVLHLKLNEISNWRNLNDLIRNLSDMISDSANFGAPASDQQMSELVHSLPGAGNIIAEQIVERSLRCAYQPDYPMTRQALKDLPITGAMAVVPFFDETLRAVRSGLRSI